MNSLFQLFQSVACDSTELSQAKYSMKTVQNQAILATHFASFFVPWVPGFAVEFLRWRLRVHGFLLRVFLKYSICVMILEPRISLLVTNYTRVKTAFQVFVSRHEEHLGHPRAELLKQVPLPDSHVTLPNV